MTFFVLILFSCSVNERSPMNYERQLTSVESVSLSFKFHWSYTKLYKPRLIIFKLVSQILVVLFAQSSSFLFILAQKYNCVCDVCLEDNKHLRSNHIMQCLKLT